MVLILNVKECTILTQVNSFKLRIYIVIFRTATESIMQKGIIKKQII